MLVLRQSTSIDIRVGPFLDATDGVTPETGVTLAGADQAEVLKANGVATAAMAGTFAAVTGADGWYDYTIATGDVDTVGEVAFVVQDSSVCLPVFVRAQVVEEAVFDALFAASAAGYNTVVPPSVAQFNARTLVAASYFDPATDTVANVTLVATATNVTNQVTSNVTAISGDSTAADNLEAMYDGTGYENPFAPAQQQQVENIASTGSAINTISESYTLTAGTQSSGAYTDADTVNQVYHVHTDTAGALELYYEFNVGADGVPTACEVIGRLNGNNDTVIIRAYDWVGAAWAQIGTMVGKAGTGDDTLILQLYASHVGTGANAGVVRIGFYAASGLTSATLYIDRIFASYAVVSRSVGYDQAAVWIDTSLSNTGTVSFIDGVADNPVSTLAAARTIADAIGLTAIKLQDLSAVTLDQDYTGFIFEGVAAVVTFASTYQPPRLISSCVVTGSTSATGGMGLGNCLAASLTVAGQVVLDTGTVSGTFTHAGASGDMIFRKVGFLTGATLDVTTVTSNLIIIDLSSGALTIEGLSGTQILFISGNMDVTLAASCVAGTVNIHGNSTITNNGSGMTINQDGLVNMPKINTECDTALIDYDGPTNAEMVARTLPTASYFDASTDTVDVGAISGNTEAAADLAASASTIVRAAAATGTLSTTQMTSNLSESTDDHYNGRIIIWTSGVLKDQATNITDYAASAGTLTFTATTEAPSNGDTFVIV